MLLVEREEIDSVEERLFRYRKQMNAAKGIQRMEIYVDFSSLQRS